MAGLSSFSHITTQLASNAKSMLSVQSQLKTLIASKSISIPPQLQQAYTQIRQGIDVMEDSRTMISAIIADSSGPLTAGSLATLTKHFDSNWDNFAKDANALYQNLSGGAQTNILETFAKSNFGDNVFYLGSAIKNEAPGVFEGVSEFQKAVDTFGGSYRDPQQAAIKIRNGVVGIVNATEKVADSLNNMIKTYKGKGSTAGVAGNPLLDAIGNLHNNKALKTVTSTLAVGTDGMAAYGSTSRFLNDLKQGNLKGALADGKQAIEDGKKVVDDIKNFDKGNCKGAAAKQPENPNDSEQEDENDEEKKDSNIDNATSDSYVCSGATMRCTFGDKEAKLIVYPDRTVYLTGQPMANISDHTSLYNIQPFGKCRTTSYPNTGSATAANHGTLTPMPCVPGTVCEWLQGKDDYIIKGKPALLKSSYCKCQWGGIITITDDGQTDTGPVDLSRESAQSEDDILSNQEEKELSKNEKLDVDAVLDGIQTSLDLAGFAPGVGAVPDLLNAAISAYRGNWTEAGLSVVAAVPGIGDAAAGVKLVKKGMKMTKAGQKVEKTAEVGKSLKNATKLEDASKTAINTKSVSKAQSKPADLLEYRKTKQDQLIDESPNVRRFPEQKATANTSASSLEKGQSGDLIHMDRYEVKQVKVGNGKTEKVFEKKTDITVASIGGVSGSGPTRGYGYTGPQGSSGKVQKVKAPNSVFDALSKQPQSQGEIVDFVKNKKGK